MTDSVLPPAARRAGIVFAWVLAALLVVAVVATAWIGIRGILAYGHLRDAQQAAVAARNAAADPAAAAGAIAAITPETQAARDLTSDPVWHLAEGLPWVGPQLAAVSTVAAALDDVAGDALEPLLDAASSFDVASLRPVDGRIDLTPFTSIQDAASTGATGLKAAAAAVASIDRAPLLGPVESAVDEVGTLLNDTSDTAGALGRAGALLPAMLGAEGPRDYLVVFQNNAEWRSAGGLTSAMALLHTDGGTITLAAQESGSDYPRYDEAVVPLDEEIEAIYGERPARWMQNVTQVPDFAVSGTIAREMWAREHGGQQVDGVIALDPVALSYLLEATGPVTLPNGDVLTSENAVSLLLNDVYKRFPRPADQDAYFASAAASVFDALAKGDVEPAALVASLVRAGDERRLLLWSAHEDDQALLADTTLAGGLPATDRDVARFGVFLNDGTGSKMDFYQTADTTLAWESCSLDASGSALGTATLTVTVANNAPADAGGSLPPYITGGGDYGVPPGTARTVGYLYLPEGFDLVDATLTGDLGFGGGTHEGRRVLSFSVDVAPGATATAVITASPVAPAAATIAVQSTPTLAANPAVAATCGGA